jgi:membrane protein DedA with SNARE-associated domain
VAEAFLVRYGLIAAFALLAVAGTGVPIPEEPTQLAAGVLAQRGAFPLAVAMAVCWAGILTGDLVWFLLARRLGPRALDRPVVRKVLTPARRAWIESHLARHGFLTVMITRHLSGLRLPVYALAATHGLRLRTFALADGASALISVPLIVSTGYLGAAHLARARSGVRIAELLLLAALLVGAVALLAVRRSRRRAQAGGPAGPPGA